MLSETIYSWIKRTARKEGVVVSGLGCYWYPVWGWYTGAELW